MKDFQKEFEVNHVKLSCYPLSAAQRVHNYSRMACLYQQLLNIGSGLYIQQETDFTLLKKAIYEAYARQDAMRLLFFAG